MVFVAERYGLVAGHVLSRDIRRADDLIGKPNRYHRYNSERRQQQPGDRVGSGTEDLHASVSEKNDLANAQIQNYARILTGTDLVAGVFDCLSWFDRATSGFISG